MDDVVESKTLHGRLILAAGALISIYVLIFMQPQEHNEMLRKEISNIEKAISTEATKVVVFRAKGWYEATMVESGLAAFIDQYHQDTGLKGDQLWRTPLTRIAQNIKTIWYQCLLRVSLLIFWFWMAVGLIAASAVDGLMQRKIKQHEFTAPSTGYFRVALWSGILVAILLELYCITPALISNEIFPLFPLFAAVIIGWLLKTTLANSAKNM